MSTLPTTTVDSEDVGESVHTDATPDDDAVDPYRVAHLEAEVAALRAALTARERRTEAVVDRYERLLADRDERAGPPETTDPERHHPAGGRSLRSRLRDLF